MRWRRRWHPIRVAALLFVTGTGALPAQARPPLIITGRVTSDQQRPVAAAIVDITPPGLSVLTNEMGRFTLSLPSTVARGQRLDVRARAIGFRWQSRVIVVGDSALTIDFVLPTDINRLEEMVVTGTIGATAKRNLPFTVDRVSAPDLRVPATDPLSQLAGKVPGVQITSFSGRPGQQPDVLLRGPRSINASGRGQGPLYILDGVVINGALPDLNPQDIESIEIVKGAAASTLYGSRAGNGVIQITTKRGTATTEGTHLATRTEYGESGIPRDFPLATRHFLLSSDNGRFCARVSGYLDCARTLDIAEEARRINEQATGQLTLPPQLFVQDFSSLSAPSKAQSRGLFQVNPWPREFDAMDAAKTNSQYVSQNVDLTGRSGAISYFASASHAVQDAPFVSVDGFSRQSVRLNVDHAANDRLHIGFSTQFSRNRSGGANLEAASARGFSDLLRVPAGIDLTQRDSLGRLFVRSNPLSYGSTYGNPLYDFEVDRQTNEGTRFIGGLNARYARGGLAIEGHVGADKLDAGFLFQRPQGYRSSRPTGTPPPTPPPSVLQRFSESQQAYNSGLDVSATHTFGSTVEARWTARLVHEQQRITTSDQRGVNLVVSGVTNTQAATDSIRIASSDQSISAIGALTGVNFVLRDRYIVDALFRRDGSSLFGADNRWGNYGRGSVAWRLTQEPWWPVPALSELKVRASLGSAGGRPRFDAQYETYAVASGGILSANTRGNTRLGPEVTVEQEYGVDAELFARVGITLNYSRAVTRDQILLVPPPLATGFASQWQNAGTLENRTWEASLNVPIITRRDLTWSARLNYDQNRPVITALGVAPYAICPGDSPGGCAQGSLAMFQMQAGERIGTIYGSKFITLCRELPAEYAAQCGVGREWQRNDEGLIVWIGEGNTPSDGITRNLWQAERYGCIDAVSRARIPVDGAVNCRTAGGTVNAPNGVSNAWGNGILLRDSTGTAVNAALGRTLPDYRLSLSQSLTFHRVSIYALLDATIGNDVFNLGRHFSFLEFQTREQDQDGRTVATAKPLAHYWRGGSPENPVGSYGFYNVLQPSTITVEDASYAKLREVSVGYNFGAIGGVGDWTVSFVGRNLYTFTRYSGFDPEVGRAGGQLGSGGINGIDAWQYPNARTFSLTIASRF